MTKDRAYRANETFAAATVPLSSCRRSAGAGSEQSRRRRQPKGNDHDNGSGGGISNVVASATQVSLWGREDAESQRGGNQRRGTKVRPGENEKKKHTQKW